MKLATPLLQLAIPGTSRFGGYVANGHSNRKASKVTPYQLRLLHFWLARGVTG